jgi:hypothetical protein
MQDRPSLGLSIKRKKDGDPNDENDEEERVQPL